MENFDLSRVRKETAKLIFLLETSKRCIYSCIDESTDKGSELRITVNKKNYAWEFAHS